MSYLKHSILFSKNVQSFFKEKPITIYDIGARGILVEPWFSLQLMDPSIIKIIGFEPDKEEYENLISSNNKIEYLPFALWNEEKEISLNIAKEPSTSSIHPPNFDLIKNFNEEKWQTRITKKVTKVSAKTLDKITSETNSDVDFIKIDTQGSEFEILEGGKQTLLNHCFGCTIETWTTEIHKGQHLSFEIMKFLHEQGFLLFNCQIGASWKRKFGDGNLQGNRQIVGLDLLYLKNPKTFFDLKPSLEKTVKAIAISDVWGFPDYAIQLIEEYEKKYSDSSLNFLKLEIISLRRKSFIDKFLENFLSPYIVDKFKVRYLKQKPSFPNIH